MCERSAKVFDGTPCVALQSGGMALIVFFCVLAVAGVGGYGVLRWLGLSPGDAWAGGRTAGLIAAVFPAWWAGSLGLAWWQPFALVVGGLLAVWGGSRIWRERKRWRELVPGEIAFWAGTLLVLWMRLPRPAIVDTEKLMDLGILSTLLRARGFPPPDMWLAGHALPYYYWGSLVWVPPLRTAGLVLDVGYNLIVAAIGGLVVALVFALGRRLARAWQAGVAAVFFAVFAGTPDGWRQLLGGSGLSLWDSSRIIPATITEFPLFTLWLGDLHPHLTSMPLALLTILVALEAGRHGTRLRDGLSLAILAGVTWAANPWAMPPVLAAVAGFLVAGDGKWRWPWGEDRGRWIWIPAVAVGAWLSTAPFQLAFHPPFQGLGLVHAWTRPDRLLLWGGVVLLPVLGAAVAELRSGAGREPFKRQGVVLGMLALLTMAGAAVGRPVLVFLAAVVALLLSRVVDPAEDPDRPALLLAVLAVFLLVIPEVLFVRDPYGAQLHRMNTVFKAYIQAWPLLGIVMPVLLRRWGMRHRSQSLVLLGLVLLAVPQTWGVLTAPVSAGHLGLDGLAWMDPGDRAAVSVLRMSGPDTVLAETPGGGYGKEGRLAAASGVPCVLGWENHERVWRGPRVGQELDRRRTALKRLYTADDPSVVRSIARELGVDVVAVGELERERYPGDGLRAVVAAGPHESEGGTILVRIGGQGSRR